MQKIRKKKQCNKVNTCFNCNNFYDCFISNTTQELESINLELNDIAINENALDLDSYIDNEIDINT